MQVIESKWLENYQLLKDYYNQYGNLEIPYSYEINGIKLRKWLTEQTKLYKELSEQSVTKVRLLSELGIMYNERSLNWDERYWLLEEYYKKHNDIDVPFNYRINNINLGKWLYTQRKKLENNKLSIERIKALENLKIKWCLREEKWDDCYWLLEEYYREYGNIDVPYNYEVNDYKLGLWLNTQRKAYKGTNGLKLSDDKILLLNDSGMKWDLCEEKWNECYLLLKQYYDKYGDIKMPVFYQINDIDIWKWLKRQKEAYRIDKNGKRKISNKHIKLLNDLEIDWNIRDTKILNSSITDNNIEKYNQVLDGRLNYILEDLLIEGVNDINNCESQQEIEKVIIKRLFR